MLSCDEMEVRDAADVRSLYDDVWGSPLSGCSSDERRRSIAPLYGCRRECGEEMDAADVRSLYAEMYVGTALRLCGSSNNER